MKVLRSGLLKYNAVQSNEVNQHFEGTYCLQLYIKRVSKARNQPKTGGMFLQNTDRLSSDYMVLHPR
jgi:hypothetical protein